MSVKKIVKNKQTTNYNSIELLDAHSKLELASSWNPKLLYSRLAREWLVASPVKSEDTVLFDKNVETSISIVPRMLCLLLPGV